MSDRKTCETCNWWKSYSDTGGHCHRYPPTPLVYIHPINGPDWLNERPHTLLNDWCGERAPKEARDAD